LSLGLGNRHKLHWKVQIYEYKNLTFIKTALTCILRVTSLEHCLAIEV